MVSEVETQQFLATHRAATVVLRGGDSTGVRWAHTAEHWTFEHERIFELPILFISNCPSLSPLILFAMNNCVVQVLCCHTEQ